MKYRTPKLDEFTEGFEYEINLTSHQWRTLDGEKLLPIVEQWDEHTVPEFTSGIHTEKYGDMTIGIVKNPVQDKKDYFKTIELCLSNNQIRVKDEK